MLRTRDAAATPSVLFLTATLGSGHRLVARAIEDALLDRRGDVRVHSADYADAIGPALYRGIRAAYVFTLRHWWGGWEWFYRAMALIQPGSALHRKLHGLGQRRVLGVLRAIDPAVVVCTFPEEAGIVSELRRRDLWHGRSLVVVTDHVAHPQWIHPHVDAYCVSSPAVAAGLVAQGVPPERVYVTGIPLRPDFRMRVERAQVRAALGLDPEGPVVLVMPGAFGDIAPSILACRVLLRLPHAVQVVLVTGQERAALRAAAQLRTAVWRPDEAVVPQGPVRVLGRVEHMAPLMQAADVLVSKAGGVTTSEALACELPMLLFRPLPGQERANATQLREQGVARLAYDRRALRREAEELLTQPQALEAMRAACRRLARPRAAETVAEILLDWLQPQ
jgi:processive 1,2-diacylglycerol beta-glucosyltransferase